MIHRSLNPLFLQHPIPKQSPFVLAKCSISCVPLPRFLSWAIHKSCANYYHSPAGNKLNKKCWENHNYESLFTMKSASGVAIFLCLERSPGVIHYCKFSGCKWKKDIAATSCHELLSCRGFPIKTQSIAPLRSGTSAFLSWTSFPAECHAPPGFRLISSRCDCADSAHRMVLVCFVGPWCSYPK